MFCVWIAIGFNADTLNAPPPLFDLHLVICTNTVNYCCVVLHATTVEFEVFAILYLVYRVSYSCFFSIRCIVFYDATIISLVQCILCRYKVLCSCVRTCRKCNVHLERHYNWNNTRIQVGITQYWMDCNLYISEIVRHFPLFDNCKFLAYHL